MRDEVEQLIVDWLKSDNENATYLADQIMRLYNVSNRYSIDDIEKCVEHWGLCKVEKEYIERFLNDC